MKIITEAALRKEFVKEVPEAYTVPAGFQLTPAALEFLKTRKIKLEFTETKSDSTLIFSRPIKGGEWVTAESYVNFYTKETMASKPEAMTHLFENFLVYKNDPRIVLRGRLDTLQAHIIELQVDMVERNRGDLVKDLDDLLQYTRQILGAEVLNQPLNEQLLMGLSSEEIRERSHHPEKYFGLKQMVLVSYRQGKIISALNRLRAESRECELCAVDAFRKGDVIEQGSLIQGLNRLSSCFHLLMYKELAQQER